MKSAIFLQDVRIAWGSSDPLYAIPGFQWLRTIEPSGGPAGYHHNLYRRPQLQGLEML